MEISFGSFIPVKQNYDYSNSSIKTSENTEVKNYSDTKLMSYPANYYLSVAFGKRSNEKTIENIGVENFPSQEIVENLRNNPDKYLYDAHIEHYAPLLDCKTLDEAKKIFPEFEDVIDSKDIDIKELDKRSTLYKVSQGEIEGANIEAISLDLLKKYYGKALTSEDKENYYGLSRRGVYKLLRSLEISVLSKRYGSVLYATNPERIEKSLAVYDITTEAGQKAREKARQRATKQYDINTTAGRKAREEVIKRNITRFDETTEAGRQARENMSKKGIARFDETTEAGRQAREEAKQRGKAQFDETTEEGQKARENLSKKGIARFDETTEEGRKAREKARQRGIIQFDINTTAGRKAREEARQRGIIQFDINTSEGYEAREDAKQRGKAHFDETTEEGRKARDEAKQRGKAQFDETTEEGRKARKNLSKKGIARFDETTEDGQKTRDEYRQRSFIQFDMNTIAGQKARDEAKMYALDYHNSNYGRIQNLSRKLSWYFNPKERYTMSQIASDNPQYAEAINKRGINIIYNNDLALLAYFKACEDAMPGHKRIKIGPVEINTANDIRNRMEAVKQGSATEDDMIILSSYYLLTKAQAPEYLDCFSEVEETLLENEDTFNEAVNRMSDFCSNMQKEYPEEIYDKCFSRLQSVLNE